VVEPVFASPNRGTKLTKCRARAVESRAPGAVVPDIAPTAALVPNQSEFSLCSRFVRSKLHNVSALRRGLVVKGKRAVLPIFAKAGMVACMSTMNISLPDHLKSFVDEQVAGRGYGTSSEYIRELIRRDQDRLALRRLLLDGASSAPTEPVDAEYFTSLRDRVRGQHSK